MEKKLKEQYDSFVLVNNLCLRYPEIWQDLSAFVILRTSLGIKIQSIINIESQQEQDNKGVTINKGEKKISMAMISVAVAAGLQAFADETKDSILLKKMSISFSEITDAKNAKAISLCTLIYNTASGIAPAAIEPYGITPAVLLAVNNSIANFAEVQVSTRSVITNKTTLTKNLLQLVNEANTIIRKRMLKIARQFAATQPEFYYELLDSAKVISFNIHSKIRVTVVDENDNPVVNAAITISGTDLTGVTDVNGKSTVTKVPAGVRDVTISKPGVFAPKVYSGLNFQRGKAISRKAVLMPAYVIPSVTESKEKVS